jgi:transcriptional regulator with XRE-family HTH domain
MPTTTAPPPFRAMREATGLSLRHVARAIEINPGRLSTIERGLVPTEAERAKLLAYLTAEINAPTATA